MKFNITLEELEKAVEYAKANGITDHKTITMHINELGLGSEIDVSQEWDSERTDITNVAAW